ncbi:MAG: hypothetical protein U0L79_09725 [Lachnospiraceae bacterium]|nr:hypothetical protein [Lachnospiraceae bacterium]
MAKPLFDPDVYELQHANILLDTLLKKEVIGMHTYKATKRTLNEMEEYENGHSTTICTINP